MHDEKRHSCPMRMMVRLVAMRIRERGDTGNEPYDRNDVEVAVEIAMTSVADILEAVLDMDEEEIERAVEQQTRFETSMEVEMSDLYPGRWTEESARRSEEERKARLRLGGLATSEYAPGEWVPPGKRAQGCTCGCCWYRLDGSADLFCDGVMTKTTSHDDESTLGIVSCWCCDESFACSS